MIGLVLVTHGRLADELRSAMEHVVGAAAQRGDRLHRPRRRHGEPPGRHPGCIARVDTGDGVVLLTDMFGGTPSNLAISMMNGRKLEVIAGVNLPMLVKLAKVRGSQTLGRMRRLRAGGRAEIHRLRLRRARPLHGMPRTRRRPGDSRKPLRPKTRRPDRGCSRTR